MIRPIGLLCTSNTVTRAAVMSIFALSAALGVAAQTASSDPQKLPAATVSRPAGSTVPAASFTSEYRIGPGDQVSISVPFGDEFNNKTFRVDSSGCINVPFAGQVEAAGLSVPELEQSVRSKLAPYFRSPNVIVNVSDYGSKPVSVLGAVNTPAVHQLHGRMTLVEMLSASGGLSQQAGSTLTVTRQIKWGLLPGGRLDPSGKFSTAEINLAGLLSGDPKDNILVCPDDTITVPRAKLIYVLGEVHKPGGFPLQDNESATVLQAVALAEGPLETAGKSHARILRREPNGVRSEIPVNLAQILDQEKPDIPLKPNDVLYVPDSKPKKAFVRGLEAAIQMGTGVVVWGRY